MSDVLHVSALQIHRQVFVIIIIQGVPGVKVSISGFNTRADAESKTTYTHGSNSQRFRSYEFLKYINKLEKKEEHCAHIEISHP
jgi:hypothetical protein